ncbi:MAG: hypothetical protein ABSF82_04850 [Candidatus Bathyarchaeia archaeon]
MLEAVLSGFECQSGAFCYDGDRELRWLIDVSVIQAFESGVLSLSDFYFTGDDYRYRFEIEAKQRFIDLIRERFNAGVACKGRVLKWDTVIEQKANEMGRFLLGKSLTLDFAEPAPRLVRNDDREMRAKILALTSSQAKSLGLEKSTLHYLRLHAKRQRFEIYGKTHERLEAHLP